MGEEEVLLWRRVGICNEENVPSPEQREASGMVDEEVVVCIC